MKRIGYTTALSIAVALSAPAFAGAGTIAVTTTSDNLSAGGKCSLREAVTAANNDDLGATGCTKTGNALGADTVKLQTGKTYDLHIGSTDETQNLGGSLDIGTGAGNGKLTIDGGAKGAEIKISVTDRVMYVGTPEFTLRRVTLHGGSEPGGNGGGIRSDSALLTLDRSTVEQSSADDGGGIYASGDLVLKSSKIIGNGDPSSTSYGGGVFVGNANLTVDHSTIRGNRADTEGAGIDVSGLPTDLVKIASSRITGNSLAAPSNGSGEQANGGGIYVVTAKVLISKSTISGNKARGIETDDYGNGGGAYLAVTAEDSKISSSTISGNLASGPAGTFPAGGGLYISSAEKALIVNSTIAANDAGPGSGGGLRVNDTDLSVIYTTIAGNKATGDGSAIDSLETGTADLVFGRTIIDGAGALCRIQSLPASSAGYNRSKGTSCGLSDPMDFHGPTGLKPLGKYGGQTRTMEPESGSAAINKVPKSKCFNENGAPLKSDQRGVKRPQAKTRTKRCDIGSVEVKPKR